MKISQALPALVLGLPLAAQAWDLRLEIPFPKGQNLPQTFLLGTGELVQGNLDTGKGFILTGSHRIIRVGPVLKFEWSAEVAQWRADGQLQKGLGTASSSLVQKGVGLGVNAQFWVPFTGIAGELGVIGRFHSYRFAGGGSVQEENLVRPWLRAGLRWNLPFPGVTPYLTASYQQPITKEHPVKLGSASDLASYFTAQGSGQEFERMWTFGAGVTF